MTAYENESISDVGEEALIRLFKDTRPEVLHALIGIGDDCAALRHVQGKDLLLSTDCMIEGVHFRSSTTPFHAVGYKAVAGNVSDIAAMGGDADYFLLSLCLPPELKLADLSALASGIADASGEYGIELIGGNLSRAESIFLNITMLGSVAAGRAVKRSGAGAGDLICLTGTVGDSAAGLYILENGLNDNKDYHWLVKRHSYPNARIQEGKVIAQYATAMIDVSDGVSSDINHICRASSVGANIRIEDLPVSRQLLNASKTWGLEAARFAMNGGEDYELLFTIPPERLNRLRDESEVHVVEIGVIIECESELDLSHRRQGFDHFREG